MTYYPKQKVSLKEKMEVLEGENYPDWIRKNVNHYIDQSDYTGMFGSGNASDNTNTHDNYKWEMVQLYRAADGELDTTLYNYVLNPYNNNKGQARNMPSQLRNYNIIKPVLNLFLGEKSKRPNNYQVVVTNADAKNRFTEGLNEHMKGYLAQAFVNDANDNGFKTGVNSQEMPDAKTYASDYSDNYNDNRAIFGQQAIDYIMYNEDMVDKIQDMFYHWLVTGRVFSFKEVYRGQIDYEPVSPLELSYPSSYGTGFLEDKDWCVRRMRWDINKCIDRFRSDLKPEIIDYLEEHVQNNISNTASINNGGTEYDDYQEGTIDVYHICWKTFKKVGILKYTDEIGQIQEREVDEDYKLDKEAGDMQLDWEWINEVWHGWRLDEDIYIGGEPFPVQRDELNNSSKCKLPYNGRVGYTVNTGLQSVVKIGLNYQMLYNIYHYRFEQTMAKNKDKIMMIPLGLIPEKFGDDPIEKFLYYVDSTGMAFFDETKPNADKVLAALKSIDLGLGKYAQDMMGFMAAIKDEWWDNIGINRQRYGDVAASAGKGTTQQAIVRSGLITEPMFRRFDKFIEKEFQGLLDCSKLAWLDGKKGQYVNSDGRNAFFEVNGREHLESDYSVFVKDNTKEKEQLDALKELVHPYAQKGTVKPHILAEMINSDNFSRLKTLLKKADEIEDQLKQAAAEKEQGVGLEIQHLKDKNDELTRALDKYKVDMDYKGDIEVANIKSDTDILLAGSETEVMVEVGGDLQAAAANRIKERALNLADRKQTEENAIKKEGNRIKEKGIDVSLAIAKENKN